MFEILHWSLAKSPSTSIHLTMLDDPNSWTLRVEMFRNEKDLQTYVAETKRRLDTGGGPRFPGSKVVQVVDLDKKTELTEKWLKLYYKQSLNTFVEVDLLLTNLMSPDQLSKRAAYHAAMLLQTKLDFDHLARSLGMPPEL